MHTMARPQLHLALALAVLLAAHVGRAQGRDLTLTLSRVSQTASPLAKCLDGTAPAYYWRAGTGADTDKAILFLEGGGWCYPSSRQAGAGANCAVRATTHLGSSASYAPSIASTGYEGGSGYLSGNASRTAFADFAVAFLKYCDGGSWTGTRMASQVRNDSKPLWYRGHYNLEAQLDDLVASKQLGGFKEVVLSGCSAGGMACYLKCDYVAGYLKKHGITTRCICDAGLFLDVPTVTGAGNVMAARYYDIATNMETLPGLPAACTASESDWRLCQFSQYALKHMQTPTFAINSLYNFGEWAMLCPTYPAGTFPPDTGTPPPDWAACYPGNGKLSPTTYAKCNATQVSIIQGFRSAFLAAVAGVLNPESPHGAFLDSCPNQHCQTSTAWNKVKVGGMTMADAAASWYFHSAVHKVFDAPFPSNPTCGYTEGVVPLCNNCANQGLGSNCLWDADTSTFHGL